MQHYQIIVIRGSTTQQLAKSLLIGCLGHYGNFGKVLNCFAPDSGKVLSMFLVFNLCLSPAGFWELYIHVQFAVLNKGTSL